MSPRPLAAALLLLTALAAVATVASAQQTASNPVPPLNSDFLITPTPILQPWTTPNTSVVEGSSSAVGVSVARLTYGPCTYRAAHWHTFAWEVLTPTSPTNSLTSVMQSPSNFNSGLSRTDILAPGQSITYPAGWMHLQLNNNCSPTSAVLVWSAVSSGGTRAITTFDRSYTNAAFSPPIPATAPEWIVDPACALRCGLNATAINGQAPLPVGALLKTQLAMTPSRIFSAEQVAAADATALFGKGVKKVAQNDAVLAAQAIASAKNRTVTAIAG